MKKIARIVSFVVLVTFLLSTVAFAALPQGIYIGGSVGKYYSLTDYVNNKATIMQEMTTAGLSNVAYIDANGKIAKADEVASKGFTAALRDIQPGDLQGTYKDTTGNVVYSSQGVEFKIVSVNVLTETKVKVKFSVAVDTAAKENFTIPGATINAATIQADKSEVVLDVAGLEVNKNYTLTASGLKVNGVVQNTVTYTFTMPGWQLLFNPVLEIKDSILKADGISQTTVRFKVYDTTGQLLADIGDVEVAFTTTFGSFATNRVTMQNGVATNLFRSETLVTKQNALITATIVEAANKNLIGVKAEGYIVLDPNPDSSVDQTVGASLTEIQASQADRVILYFNKDVTPEKYAVPGTKYVIDPNKATVSVYSVVNNVEMLKNVKGLLPVPGNSKALMLLLDVDDVVYGSGNALVDNAQVKVTFEDRTGSIPVLSTKYCVITDARKPSMLGVAREGLNTVKVIFSEAVERGSAVNPENWVIDGIPLSNTTAWGNATVSVGTFNTTTGEDTRHVVTIKLGADKYFTPGTHTIQGARIQDWAGLTDPGANVMETQTLDFTVPEDNTKPTATIDVQSPEQWVISFDKELSDTLTSNELKMQKWNSSTGTWEDVSDKVYFVETPTGSAGIGRQEIKVTMIDTTIYKLEAVVDWTYYYNTSATNTNYYNDKYRIVINANAVKAAANGKTNDEIILTLGGPMLTPDVTSPSIVNIEPVDADSNGIPEYYKVTMSEPVKGFDGLPTLAQNQPSLPIATAQFIKTDNSKTVNATVDTTALDKFDKVIKVTPETPLDAGDWMIVVRSISDDVGNTAASATKNFTVAAQQTAPTAFRVLWVAADCDGDKIVNETTYAEDNPNSYDYIYIKFSKPIKLDSANSALRVANYVLDGMQLPTGTQIFANIAGYDDTDDVIDSVTIQLPNGWLAGKDLPHVLVISNTILDKDGNQLTNGGAKVLPWQDSDQTELLDGKIGN
ncbi:hypothetical protein ELD05_13030 [Caldicellulosiruptor changbaiensis]|uniref:SbsA Ig-like domain-containing protein n=1 Tax=Caldicellulosiruptor changbaiensis TaxID=1222016 RepID=A0A3T0D961_9FIRM|nr:hypothetical protein [Caldicellulosiruptor changbaiensis]AZT91449.1 hypothetical protein ELD05_13030 [Caldicellulosiruptor changbaiensis]